MKRLFVCAAAMGIAGAAALSAQADEAYIQSAGAQVIDTGYYPNPGTRIVIDFDYLALKKQVRFFGTRMDDNNYLTFEMYNSGQTDGGGGFSWAFCDGTGNWYGTGYGQVTKSRVRFDMDGVYGHYSISTNGLVYSGSAGYVDGVAFSAGLGSQRPRTKTAKYSLALFGSQTAAKTYSNFSTIRLYSCQIWDRQRLVHYYLPYKSGTTIGLKDVVTGEVLTSAKTAFSACGGDISDDPQGDPAVLAAAAAAEAAYAEVEAARAGARIIAPGTGVSTNVPPFGGDFPVQVNETNAPGGFVTMATNNWYAGDTWVENGTLELPRLLDGDGVAGSLGRSGALHLNNGVLRYAGPSGATFSRAITNDAPLSRVALVFDVATDLALTGPVGWDHGAFVKTGSGTLTLDSAGTHVLGNGDGFTTYESYAPLKCDAGGVPTNGVSGFSHLEGRIVVKSGTWNFNSGADEAKIGGTTVDPSNPDGGQEKSAVFQLDGGTVNFYRWLAVGRQNGFATTTPDEVPSSGIIVNGGTFNARSSLVLGRNFLPEAYSVNIAQRTCPFIEVHGGKFNAYNASRIGLCDDPGADARLFVDGGEFHVWNATGSTGSGMTFGNQQHGDATLARHADVTVCTNGILDVTDFWIAGSKQNVTVSLKVLNGGVFRTNTLRKGGTGAGCEMHVLFDGGVAEHRYDGMTAYINADLTSAQIGTHGVVFRSGKDVTANRIDTIARSFSATNSYPGEAAQGVTFRTVTAGKNCGFRFTAAQYWDGPTVVESGATCEIAAAGALPAGTDLTLSGGGHLVVAGASQTVASFTLGMDGVGDTATVSLLAGRTITAGAFATTGGPVAFNLYSAMTANTKYNASGTALAAAGTYPLLVGPASQAPVLSDIAARAAWANAPADGFAYSFDVTTDGDTATLALTVAATAEGETAGLVSPLDLVVPSVSGETTNVTADAVSGKRSVTTNPTTSGGGTVALGDSLAGLAGPLAAGSGLTTISDLSFASSNPTWLTLGPGTLHYTGDGATVAGLYVNAGAGRGGVLRTDGDLTLLGASTGTGSIMKKGAGDLILKGNGTFYLGNQDNAYSSKTDSAQGVGGVSDGVAANGDGPTTGLKNFMVSEGRVVIGTVGDDADAPYVTSAGGFSVGHRSAVTEGATETAGELVLNNGTLYSPGTLWLSFYCGMLATTPAEGLHPKVTVNGGTFSVGSVTMNHDWQGNQTTSPTLEVNGGAFNCRGTFVIGNQLATSGVEQVSRVIVNGGALTTKTLTVGNAAKSVASEIHVNDGGTLAVSNTFTLGLASTANPQKLYVNAGGTLKTLREIAHTTGESYIWFRGGTWQPGLGRASGVSYEFGSSTAAKRHTGVYLGAGGLTIDFTAHWEEPGVDAGTLTIRQPFLHDPDCAGDDGGITFRGHVTSILRTEMNGSTFTGPITAEEGFTIGVDNAWKGFLDKAFVLKPSAGFRASGDLAYVNRLTMGEAGGTDPVVLDFCADRAQIGLVVSNELAVLSPVTVAFHRPGGASNITGMQTGTYAALIYPASLDDEGLLARFVANPNFPEYAMTFAKDDEQTGKWPGWKQITVTVTAAGTAAGTTWLDGTTGGAWSDGAKWDGGAAPNGTNALPVFTAATAANVPVTLDADVTAGTVTLQGETAESGYAISGNALNLNHRDFKSPPAVVALSGTHALAADVTTDDFYKRSHETEANGGYTGSIGLFAQSNATLAASGAMWPDPQRAVVANPPVEGGGTVKFTGTLARGTGLIVNSGTVEMDDASKLDGKTLTVKDGTFRFTGHDGYTTARLVTTPSANTNSAIIRTDGDLIVAGQVNSTTGGILKRGPGRLVFAYPGTASVTNRIGYYGGNTSWNSTGAAWYWPDNGDNSKKQSCGSFCIDEGEVALSGANALYHIANNGNACDCFVGANDRGWEYATNYAALTILSGTVRCGWFYLGHTFNRGTDAQGNLIHTYSVYNQFGGDATFTAFNFCYDLSDFDTACQATANLYGGTIKVTGVMRFGQTYNKTGVNPPHATFNVYGGTYTHTDTSGTKGTRMGYLGSKSDGQKSLNRACDATLNLYGGLYDEIERIHMGCNASTSRLNLHGGTLKAENIFLHDAADNNYCFFTGGSAYLYWNGGTYAPVGSTAANQTLADLTEALVSTNGAVVTTDYLAGDLYTIAQSLLHDPALDGADGGLVKTGAKPLALTGANTYTGDTVVEEGTLVIPAAATSAALPAGSAVVVAEGATLEMAHGTAARAGGLRFDMGTQSGTLAGFAPAAAGTLYVTGVGETARKGLVMPVTVTDAQHPNLLTRWAVNVDGDLDDSLSAFVRGSTIVVDGKQGMYIIVK